MCTFQVPQILTVHRRSSRHQLHRTLQRSWRLLVGQGLHRGRWPRSLGSSLHRMCICRTIAQLEQLGLLLAQILWYVANSFSQFIAEAAVASSTAHSNAASASRWDRAPAEADGLVVCAAVSIRCAPGSHRNPHPSSVSLAFASILQLLQVGRRQLTMCRKSKSYRFQLRRIRWSTSRCRVRLGLGRLRCRPG